jgi:hypothetical protein
MFASFISEQAELFLSFVIRPQLRAKKINGLFQPTKPLLKCRFSRDAQRLIHSMLFKPAVLCFFIGHLQTSRFCTSAAWASMNWRRGSTLSPMRTVKMSSASELLGSSFT